MAQSVADRELLVDFDALEQRAVGAERPGDEHLAVERRGYSRHVRQFAQAVREITPVIDSGPRLFWHDIDVRHGAEEVPLQSAAESIVDAERDYERHDSDRYAADRDEGDYRDHLLLAARAEVAIGDEELELRHGRSSSRIVRT